MEVQLAAIGGNLMDRTDSCTDRYKIMNLDYLSNSLHILNVQGLLQNGIVQMECFRTRLQVYLEA